MGNRQADIERYLRGEMTPAEMHALEKEALQDPFLSEALEGISQAGTDNFLFDLKALKSSVGKKSGRRKPRIISMWNWSLGIAAGLVLLSVCGVYIISTIQQQNKNQIAQTKTAEKKEVVDDKLPVDSTASSAQHPSETKTEINSVQQDQSPDNRTPSLTDRTSAEENTERSSVSTRRTEIAEAPAESNPPAEIQGPRSEAEIIVDLSEANPTVTKIIKGKVISAEDGSSLPGVNVLVKGTSTGTVTDAEGNYQIPLHDENSILTFEFIGMQPVEVAAANKKQIDVTLTPDYSQLSEVVVDGVAEVTEFAEPQGGRKAFQQYLQEKMNYPEQALENKVEGRVTVQFTVGTSGQLEDFKILKGIGYGCDDEVIRLIKEGPAWSPSKRNAQPVPEKVKVRLKFDIPDK